MEKERPFVRMTNPDVDLARKLSQVDFQPINRPSHCRQKTVFRPNEHDGAILEFDWDDYVRVDERFAITDQLSSEGSPGEELSQEG